jgi:Fic family protein
MSVKMSDKYEPPFTINTAIVNLAAEISALVERVAIRLEQSDSLRLRRINQIQSIHSSLAIEGNSLSEGQVSDIIDGKRIIAPEREILEVKNALRTYELYPLLKAFSEKDLLKAHAVMMQGIIPDAGRYRNCNEGVFKGRKCVHFAPPPNMVPILMKKLFSWLKNSKDHWLVRSCVFHYEFEFIHPFRDGNGRIGRLWQSLILGKWNPLFAHLPVENLVYANQHAYYNAINASSAAGDCSIFVEFMLNRILDSLKAMQKVDAVADARKPFVLTDRQKKIVSLLKKNNFATEKGMAEKFAVTTRTIERDLAKLQDNGILERAGSKRDGYWIVK